MPNFLRDCNGPGWEDKLLAKNIRINALLPSNETTAGNVTYSADQMLTGILVRDPNGASRADIFPTAAQIVAALAAKFGTAAVGMRFEFILCNNADAAETITMTLGTGMTTAITGGTQTSAAIGQNSTKRFAVHVTNVTPGSEAVVLYA